ncbi:hypothetical protein Droror1_Dr00013207 [Drosera rotundifolia]
MTSLATIASSPSCYQLRFSFESRKSQPQLLVTSRLLRSDRRWSGLIRCCGFNGAQRVRLGGGSDQSWSRLAASSTELSDWAAGDGVGGELVSDEEPQKSGIGGIMGAALAGVFLVTGLTFAALAIGRRGTQRVMQEMKPLSQQQAMLLSSSEEFNLDEEDEKDGKFIVQDEKHLQDDHALESKSGIEEKSSVLSEFSNGVTRSTLSDHDVDLTFTTIEHPESMSSNHTTSVQEDLPYDSAFDGQDSYEISSLSQQLPILEAADGLAYASGFTDSDNVDSANPEIHLSVVEPNNKTSPGSAVKTSESTGVEKSLESDTSPIIEELSTRFVSSVPAEPESVDHSGTNNLDVPAVLHRDEGIINTSSNEEDFDIRETIQVSDETNGSLQGLNSSKGLSEEDQSIAPKKSENGKKDVDSATDSYKYYGIPAPSAISASLLVHPGKVLVPAAVDQVHGQALTALQVLKVIEPDAQPSHLCTRREYARWLLSASGSLSRNSISKVYPAMYIENVSELAFDDIAPEDPDFASIQGLAEAGLISSKLSRRDLLLSSEEDMVPLYFFPDSPLSRQDLVTWKIALEKKQLPDADRKILRQLSGFIDIDRIDRDAWPALVADISAGEHGIIALAFGYTRLFQPDKPVTKAQAAIALSTGEAADVVSEELARIEAESVAENAVAAHSALVAEVEKDINANFEKNLLVQREKIEALEKMAEEARQEVERLRGERERGNVALMKERAAIDSEMEVLSRMKREVEEQLESLMTKKIEISYEKDRIDKLQKETEEENLAISQLQHDLEVERKALAMARAWAEEEAKRVREHAKALEEARERWEGFGIRVVVDDDLREEASAGVTWLQMERENKLSGTVERAETLVDKLKVLAAEVRGRSKEVINNISERVLVFISIAKEWIPEVGRRGIELKEVTVSKLGDSVQEIQHHTAGFCLAVKEGANRFIEDCREGVGKLSQKFKTT